MYKYPQADLHSIQAEINKLEYKVMMRKEHVKELETKMEIIASKLDAFQSESMVISF